MLRIPRRRPVNPFLISKLTAEKSVCCSYVQVVPFQYLAEKLNAVGTSLTSRQDFFVAHLAVFRSFACQANPIGNRQRIIFVLFVKPFERHSYVVLRTELHAQNRLVGKDVFHPFVAIGVFSCCIFKPERRISRLHSVTSEVGIQIPLVRKHVRSRKSRRQLVQGILHVVVEVVAYRAYPERQFQAVLKVFVRNLCKCLISE
ncbi:hypothetical protein SDC9_74238 [bioreactor metagenome]|uniref:Uncharacterized protein n=1 Tax=bioreactor metagenome TaxID=1076179 RepID=A0A644YGN0_9ZZZZ